MHTTTQFRSAGFTIIQLIVWGVAISLVIGGFFYLLNTERAKTRDAKRMSDITRVQAAFEVLYATSASYKPASDGCGDEGTLVSSCTLSLLLPDIAQIKDPGNFSYVITQIPGDEEYAVTFELERAYGTFTAGQHVLTQDGIR